MAHSTHLDVHHVLQVIRGILHLTVHEMAACTGLSVQSYRLLEQHPPVVPNAGWNRLFAGMAIVDAVFGGEPGAEIKSVTWEIMARINELERMDVAERCTELNRLYLELAWIDAGGL
jgi:hypothetical protein